MKKQPAQQERTRRTRKNHGATAINKLVKETENLLRREIEEIYGPLNYFNIENSVTAECSGIDLEFDYNRNQGNIDARPDYERFHETVAIGESDPDGVPHCCGMRELGGVDNIDSSIDIIGTEKDLPRAKQEYITYLCYRLILLYAIQDNVGCWIFTASDDQTVIKDAFNWLKENGCKIDAFDWVNPRTRSELTTFVLNTCWIETIKLKTRKPVETRPKKAYPYG